MAYVKIRNGWRLTLAIAAVAVIIITITTAIVTAVVDKYSGTN